MTAHTEELPAPRLLGRTAVAAGLALLAATATIAGAWGFELIGHYMPCALCLKERIPYYVGIPVAILAFVLSLNERTARIGRFLLLVVAGIFAWSVYQGVFHIGIEYRWWNPLLDCASTGGDVPRTAAELLAGLNADVHAPSCTDATWRFPAGWGLSFAGWNAVISAGIVMVALYGVFGRRRAA